MLLYSSDNSIFINKVKDCVYDFKVNPSILGSGGGGGGGLSSVLVSNTNTIALNGNGSSNPLTADVIISASAGNILQALGSGLYVPTPATYTDAQARAALSASLPLTYNSSTGAFGINQANNIQSGFISSTDWNTFNNKVNDGANVGGVTSISIFKQKNGTNLEFRKAVGGTGITVSQSGDDVVITSSVIQYTDAQARASVSASPPLSYNSSTGVFSIPVANTSTNGYLSSADWNTFNGKVGALANLGSTGSRVFSGMSGATANLRRVIGSDGIVATENTNDITLTAQDELPTLTTTTSNATPVTVATLTIENNSTGIIEVWVNAILQTSATSALVQVIFCKYHKVAGTLSILGIVDDLIPQSLVNLTTAAPSIIINGSNNLEIRVTGEAGKTIKWKLRPTYKFFQTA